MNDVTGRVGHASVWVIVPSVAILLAIALLHVFLLNLEISANDLLTFWVPLEAAGFLVLYATFSSDAKWVLGLVLAFALSLHLVLPLSGSPNYVSADDPTFGYQRVADTIASGHWIFGAGTGSALTYSFFPMIFVFVAAWSEVSSVSPILIANYGIGLLNLTTFLVLRMLNIDVLKLPEKVSNLVLFFYALTPEIHSVDSLLHYEAYAVIFFPLVIAYVLKPRLSVSETIVALLSVLSIALSHLFTSYMLLFELFAIGITYVLLRGTRIQQSLLFPTAVAVLGWTGTVAVFVFGQSINQLSFVLSKLSNLNALFNKLFAGSTNPLTTYYPAPWFSQLSTTRNAVVLLLGVVGVVSLCLSRAGWFKLRISRRDAFTYLSGAWIFSLLFAIAAYYGVVWSETEQVFSCGGCPGSRVVEFAFFNFSIFAGIGIVVIVDRLRKRLNSPKLEFTEVLLGVFLIVILVSTTVVQAYPRTAYDSSFSAVFIQDEYTSRFQAPYYVGNWWNGAANHTLENDRPFTGSRVLASFIEGYGYQVWWEDNMTSPYVNMNNITSAQFTVYYAIDTQQIQKPDHLYGNTLSPQIISAQNKTVNMIFNCGRIIVLNKMPTPT